MIKRTVLFLQFILLISFSYSQDVTLSLDGGNLNYSSSADMAGFQFTHDGCVTGASAGEAADAGFTVQAGGTTVLGFSISGGTIPAGCGTLINLELDGDATGLNQIVVSDNTCSQIYFE